MKKREERILWERESGGVEVHAKMPAARRAHPHQTACGLNWAGRRALVVDRKLTCACCCEVLGLPAPAAADISAK